MGAECSDDWLLHRNYWDFDPTRKKSTVLWFRGPPPPPPLPSPGKMSYDTASWLLNAAIPKIQRHQPRIFWVLDPPENMSCDTVFRSTNAALCKVQRNPVYNFSWTYWFGVPIYYQIRSVWIWRCKFRFFTRFKAYARMSQVYNALLFFSNVANWYLQKFTKLRGF